MIRLGLKTLLSRPEFLGRLAALLQREANPARIRLAERIVAAVIGSVSRGWAGVGCVG